MTKAILYYTFNTIFRRKNKWLLIKEFKCAEKFFAYQEEDLNFLLIFKNSFIFTFYVGVEELWNDVLSLLNFQSNI